MAQDLDECGDAGGGQKCSGKQRKMNVALPGVPRAEDGQRGGTPSDKPDLVTIKRTSNSNDWRGVWLSLYSLHPLGPPPLQHPPFKVFNQIYKQGNIA